MNNENRRIRIKNVNFFVKNNGIVNLKSFIFIFFLVFELFLTFVVFVEYKFFQGMKGDVWVVLNQVGGDIFILQRYLLLHYLDNTLVRNYNTFVSDIKDINIQIPYIKDLINYGNFTMSFDDYLLLIVSFLMTFSFFLIIILQIREQKRYSSVGLHSIYSPLWLILLSYYDDERHYYKTIDGMKKDTITKDKQKQLIELFFYNNDTFIDNDINNIEYVEETKQLIAGYIPYFKITIKRK